MKKYSFDFELPESYKRTEAMLDRLNKSVSIDFSALSVAAEKVFRAYDFSAASTAMTALQAVMDHSPKMTSTAGVLAEMIAEKMVTMPVIDRLITPSAVELAASLGDLIPKLEPVWNVPEFDWDWVTEGLSSYNDEDEANISELLTPEVQSELKVSVTEVISDQDNMEVKAKAKFLQWQEEHPLLAIMFIQLLACIVSVLSGLTLNYLTGKTAEKTEVYKEPSNQASIVVNVEVNQNITIIDVVDDYYEIVFEDLETGKQIVGYIPKEQVVVENAVEKDGIEMADPNMETNEGKESGAEVAE